MPDLLTLTKRGLYCAAGDFHVDPWRGVDRAVITHGHADHARAGSAAYLCAAAGVGILKSRLGSKISVRGVPYGDAVDMNGVKVSFHGAGHVLGSAQVRVEHRGEVWVASGDYKTQDDGVSGAFEPVACDTFITESTFGLPVYRWPEQSAVVAEINRWWQGNRELGRTSVLFAYSLGKAQRILGAVDPSIGPIHVHSAVAKINAAYAAEGVKLPPVNVSKKAPDRAAAEGALVVTPAAADDSAWLRCFGEPARAFASGWMRVRGGRRWQNLERGFVMSDHVDWPGMIGAIKETGAERILVTHGYSGPTVRYLREQGWDADELETRFGEEETA